MYKRQTFSITGGNTAETEFTLRHGAEIGLGSHPVFSIYLANDINGFTNSAYDAFAANQTPVYTIGGTMPIVANTVNIPEQHTAFNRLIITFRISQFDVPLTAVDVSNLSATIPESSEEVPDAHTLIRIQKSYERKVIGLGSSRVRTVLMYADNENVQAFGIGTGIKTGDMWKQYLHTVAATLDVQSNISEADHYELVSDITEVLKYNKIYGDWISIEVLGSKNLSGEMRNRWRTVIDIRGKIYAPNA